MKKSTTKTTLFFLHHDENSSRFDEILKFLSLSHLLFLTKSAQPTLKLKITFNLMIPKHSPRVMNCLISHLSSCVRASIHKTVQDNFPFLSLRIALQRRQHLVSLQRRRRLFSISRKCSRSMMFVFLDMTHNRRVVSRDRVVGSAGKSFPHLAASNGTWGALRMRVLERQ